MTDKELAEIESVWVAASRGPWRVEKQRDGDRYKLYAVSPPNMHDAYLLDISAGDARYAANLEAIAKAPEHIKALLAEVKRLRFDYGAMRVNFRAAKEEIDTLRAIVDASAQPARRRDER